jgi:hypothetical protein
MRPDLADVRSGIVNADFQQVLRTLGFPSIVPHRQTQMIRAIHLATVVLLAGCGADPREGPATRGDSTVSAPSSSTETRTAADDTLIRPAAPRHTYTLLDSATADVDGDGTPERVELAATVELDTRGEPLWDDGHTWMVAVRDGADTYPLIERFVPWGGAAFWIVAEDSAGPAAVLVQTSTYAFGGGGVRLEKFVFDRARGGYARIGSVGASGNPAAYRGPPAGIGILPPTPR